MKIILLQDVPKVGHKYDIKEVADGFARNVLLKGNKAVAATPHEISRVNKLKAEREAQNAHKNTELKSLLAMLKNDRLVVKGKASKEGNLFAAIHEKEIIDAITNTFKVTLESSNIRIIDPIKKTGSGLVELKTKPIEGGHATVIGEFEVIVESL
jgi:large subunit ribosomal protein L9